MSMREGAPLCKILYLYDGLLNNGFFICAVVELIKEGTHSKHIKMNDMMMKMGMGYTGGITV